MISKKTTMIAASLTAFLLVVFGGVVSALRQTPPPANENTVAAEVPVVTTAPTQVALLTPQEAASIAARFMGKQDLFSVESSNWNNVSAYKVVFSSGDIVYVGLDGKILAAISPTVPSFVSSPRGGDNGGSSSGESSREDEDEHENEGGDD